VVKIITFHRVDNDPADHYAISPERFGRMIRWLKSRRYQGRTISEALQANSRKVVGLAFDDGACDFYEVAWPILREVGFYVTVFIVAGRIGQTSNWPELQGISLLKEQQVRELNQQGVEVASHGWSHRAYDEQPPEQILRDMQQSREKLSQIIGYPPQGLAYPYGRSSNEIVALAEQAGYEWACTARSGFAPVPDRYRLRRTLIRRKDTLLRFALKVRFGYADLIDWRMDIKKVS
jgi:peptidoglycan/xylan/chitin deacetylase (PgdA/CDA1 family)